MSIKITVPNTSNDALTFGSANTPTAAQVVGIDSGSSNGQLALYTTASGVSTERMRIDSSGNLLVGTTSATGTSVGTGVQIIPNLSGIIGLINIGHVSSGSGNPYHQFYYNNGMIGSITQNGTTGVLYNLTSDYRLKNNPVPVTGAKDFVMALQPKTWDWWDGSGKGVGFIAHEFMEVAKYSGNGIKDAVDADGKPVYQSIQPSSSEVMANLVSLIQEQQALITDQGAIITDLKASITSLEARIETLEAK